MDRIDNQLLLDILGNLTKLRKDFPYTLLLFTMDYDTLMNTLDVFQGATVTFPTKDELLELVRFTIAKKYDSYDDIPKEVLGDLTRKRYNELNAILQESD